MHFSSMVLQPHTISLSQENCYPFEYWHYNGVILVRNNFKPYEWISCEDKPHFDKVVFKSEWYFFEALVGNELANYGLE